MALWLFETTVIKVLFKFSSITIAGLRNIPFCEYLSYTGYKFVPLCLIVLSQMAFGNLASYGVLILTGLLFAIFFF